MEERLRMRNYIRIAATVFFAVSAVVNCGLAAYAGVQRFRAETVNHLETGNIKIELREYGIGEDGEETDYTYKGEVVPGSYVSKIPRIQNLSSDCYIRIKTEYKTDLSLEDSSLEGISDNWIKRGEYWYYQPILSEEESTDFFHGIRFPEEWDESMAGKEMILSLQAEAIQARNFTPDYTREDPWYGETAQHCLQEFGVKGIGEDNAPLYVIYEDSLSVDPTDFFENMGKMMPGDQYSDFFTIENKNREKAEIRFRTELLEMTKQQKEVLDGIGLTIQKDDQILYQGNLASLELEDGVSLGEIAGGGSERVLFSVAVPEEWDNTYTFRDTVVKWIFETERITADPSPDTGEYGEKQGWIFFGLGMASFLILLTLLYGGERKNKA